MMAIEGEYIFVCVFSVLCFVDIVVYQMCVWVEGDVD